VPAPSNPELPAYVTSSSGFAAHPNTIIAQNKALLERLGKQEKEAQTAVQSWEQAIKDRELAEKRRKAPGWLDSEDRMLEPSKAGDAAQKKAVNLMDEPAAKDPEAKEPDPIKTAEDLSTEMDRVFGRSEMG
jgi:hypothetical protein